jgi:hypothetical protein
LCNLRRKAKIGRYGEIQSEVSGKGKDAEIGLKRAILGLKRAT